MRKRFLIMADYRCGCIWVGLRDECIEYCAKHGEKRWQIIKVGREGDRDIELGWDWQMDKKILK
jgi:hypothetical protein